jgi:hypothetical protein
LRIGASLNEIGSLTYPTFRPGVEGLDPVSRLGSAAPAPRDSAASDFPKCTTVWAEHAMTKQRRSTSRRERQAAAEELAIAALGFIAGEPEQLGRFLAMTGIGPDSLREAARAPRFLAGVLDHVAADEALLLAFAAAKEIDPEAVMRARDILTGGHWDRDTP